MHQLRQCAHLQHTSKFDAANGDTWNLPVRALNNALQCTRFIALKVYVNSAPLTELSAYSARAQCSDGGTYSVPCTFAVYVDCTLHLNGAPARRLKSWLNVVNFVLHILHFLALAPSKLGASFHCSLRETNIRKISIAKGWSRKEICVECKENLSAEKDRRRENEKN